MTQRRQFLAATAAASAAASLGIVPSAARATQGVSKNEIVVGSIQDLSGPIAILGKLIQNGMILRVEQINAAGGINGRKLRLVVEDSGYDPKKAVLAGQKLQHDIKAYIGVSADVKIVAEGTIERSIGKAKRVIDKRPK